MLDFDSLNEEEQDIFRREFEQLQGNARLKGNDSALQWASRAVERHRELRQGKMKVGQGRVEDVKLDKRLTRKATPPSPKKTVFLPPLNGDDLFHQCLDQICKAHGLTTNSYHSQRYVRSWVMIAMTTALGTLVTSKILKVNKGVVSAAPSGLPANWALEAREFGATLRPTYEKTEEGAKPEDLPAATG